MELKGSAKHWSFSPARSMKPRGGLLPDWCFHLLSWDGVGDLFYFIFNN
jgi:hypothetical protein